MRRTIAITCTPKRMGAEAEIRLFTMNERQSDLFVSVVRGVARASNLPLEEAGVVVEKAVVKMLAGRMPREDSPRVFLEMRLAFPVLRPRDGKKLPRAGCPRGRITALILGIVHGETKEARTVLIELDRDQADFHRDAMEEIMARDGCSKDDAWTWTNNLIGQMLAGATLKGEGNDEMLLMRAVALFPGLTSDELLKLPRATESDVRRWSFTEDRARA